MNRALLFFMPAGWSLRPGAHVRGDGILDAVATGPRRRWSDLGLPRRRELLLAALLLFAYGFFQQQPAWNENSRYDLVRALVEEGTTQIDSFQANTGDKALYQGHWYSDKSPGSALLGVPVYVLLIATGAITGQGLPDGAQAVPALAFVESGVATTLLVLLLVRFLRSFVGARWSLAVGLAYGFGSIAYPFATMFFGHAASTAALFAAFYLLHRLRERPSDRGALAAGFLAGLAVLIEIPVVLGVAALFAYALSRGRGVAARFIAGGIPLAVVLLAYNWLTFGSPFSIGYQYTPTFASQNAQGLVSIVWPQLDTTGELLFGARGLIRLAPWFALAPLGLLALRRREVRFEILLAAVIAVAFLAYNSGALNPFGGWTPGPRYLLPALPFAAILVAFVPPRVRLVAVPLMVIAAGVFFVATATMPNAPERFMDPLFELWLPRFASGELAETAAWIRWGLHGSAVLAVLLVGAGLGALSLAFSFRQRSLARRAAGRGFLVMALLALAFSVPFPPVAPVVLGWDRTSGSPEVSIVLLGHTSISGKGVDEVELWARVENRGSAIPSSRAQFTVWDASGEGVWTAWYGELPIAAGSRRTITMTWSPSAVPPGSYTYGLSVRDESLEASFASLVAADRITLDP